MSFAFVTGFVTMCSGPSLAPQFAGFTVPARPTRDNRNGRLISCAGGQVFLVRLGGASSAMRAVHVGPGEEEMSGGSAAGSRLKFQLSLGMSWKDWVGVGPVPWAGFKSPVCQLENSRCETLGLCSCVLECSPAN